MSPRLDIIIVNWNSGEYLYRCLLSLMNASHLGFDLDRVVVVDNASTDGSLVALDDCRLPLTVIRNSVNRGFAAGCNQGSAATRADYLLFLNPDVLLCDRSLEVAIRFMEERAHSDVGICGVRLFDQKGYPTVAAGRFPTAWIFLGEATGLRRIAPALFQPQLLSPDECRTTHDVDQIIGAFFLVRRSLFDALSGFDERFFLYFEEVDFSLRARAMGHRSVLLADGSAVHRGGTSSEQIRATRMFYSLRSRLLYGAKHYSLAEYVLLTVITLGIEPISRLTLSMFRWRPGDVLDVVRAYGRLLAALSHSDRGRSLLDRRHNG